MFQESEYVDGDLERPHETVCMKAPYVVIQLVRFTCVPWPEPTLHFEARQEIYPEVVRAVDGNSRDREGVVSQCGVLNHTTIGGGGTALNPVQQLSISIGVVCASRSCARPLDLHHRPVQLSQSRHERYCRVVERNYVTRTNVFEGVGFSL